jgi:hypothetical protein
MNYHPAEVKSTGTIQSEAITIVSTVSGRQCGKGVVMKTQIIIPIMAGVE